MENRRVTCIMTVFKKYKYIYRAIDSILDQSYEEIELIICDDCSGDFPESEIRDYIECHRKDNLKNMLIYSNSRNLGTVKNFNAAIRRATGFYFISLSSDDIFYEKDVMKNVVKKFDETGTCYGTCRAIMESGDKRHGLCFQAEADIRNIKKMKPEKLYDRITRDNIILGACTYFTKEAIEKYGYFDENYIYIEDLPRFLSLCRGGEKIEFFDITAIWHTMDGISNSKVVSVRYLQDNLNICNNEVIKYRERLSVFSYRYNLCRKKSLEYRIKNDGCLLIRNKIKLAVCYSDAVFYNILISIKRKFAKHRRLA